VLASLTLLSGAAAAPTVGTTADWPSFGGSLDQNRHSSLQQVTRDNVGQLTRAFTFDLNKAIPGIKKGQQSYPVVVDGRMYVTSGDDQVFAVDAATGELLWHYAPDNIATFKNFGIVANRGVSYCDGRIFLLTLDMTIVALDPRTGRQLQRVPIARAVPGADASYGYSETSAPICANHRLIAGAAGSEYGVRGFVMAWRASDLTPAWANPFWTVPPANVGWRRFARIVGGGVVWTPVTVDTSTSTVYFGTGAAMPPYYPAVRPGPNPRADSVVALDLNSGRMRWWQQQLSSNEWSYDSSQPPLVYSARIGGQDRRIVSIATMEGVWFAYDARTGQPLYQRVKVIDNVEHPSLKPGKPVVVYPASIGGLNYSPASFDPDTHYIFNAAAETAAVFVQQTPSEKARAGLLAGDVYLGLSNGDYGQYLRNGWKDYGSISAIDVATGKRVWKFTTPEPERGGITTTTTGLGFAGGGDGVMRAFNTETGKVLWTFPTGFPIAAGPTIYSVAGKQYVAIAVGGTPTSSNGGTVASQIQVFALGASPRVAVTAAARPVGATGAARELQAVAARAAARASAHGRIAAPAVPIQAWNADTSNLREVQARLVLDGKPVEGARIRVDGWPVPRATDANGGFVYPADATLPRRHVATVVSADGAKLGGRALTAAQKRAVLGSSGGISVGYRISGLRAQRGAGGLITVTGSVGAAPHVVLYSYRLTGVVSASDGSPVRRAIVTTRTNDRQYWTQSRLSGGGGKYASFLVAANTLGDDPVPMSVGVAVGEVSYAMPVTAFVNFQKLRSAVLNIKLPATPGGALTDLSQTPVPGAIYQGLMVGVVGKGRLIRPLRATWPDASGRFTLVLPARARGLDVRFWQAQRQFFTAAATRPGGPLDLGVYPTSLPPDAPQGIATLKLPG
jgi:alcohol dehydrogenase (cytochrome c)